MNNNVTAKTALNWVASLMFLQAFTKLVHFFFNNLIIIGLLSPEKFGLSSLQLPLITFIVPRILKEAFHRAAVRDKNLESRNSTMIIVWWCTIVTIIVSSIISLIYVQVSSEIQQEPLMKYALFFWVASAWFDIFIEPFVIQIEKTHPNMNPIIFVECISLLLSTFSVATLLHWYSENDSHVVLILSFGQFVNSGCLALFYFLYSWWWNPVMWEQCKPRGYQVTWQMISDSRGFIYQSMGKYFNAEAENLILLFFGTIEQQGIFQFVSSLGSIVVRIFFASLEKAGFVLFTRLNSTDPEITAERRRIWTALLTVSILISCVYLALCPNYIHVLVGLFYKQKWANSEAPTLLGWYGVCLLLMGMNGLVEAMRDAVGSPEKIAKQAKLTSVVIGVYLIAAVFLMKTWGAGGLLAAACLSTSIRMYINVTLFDRELFPISDGFPSKRSLLFYTIVFLAGLISRQINGDTLKHLGFGILEGIGILFWLKLEYWGVLSQTLQIMKDKKKSE